MDNISQRRSNDDGSCTANSMYLSFDAESTMSTACYKTLEAMTDISSTSVLSIIDDHGDNIHMNSTLENKKDSELLSPLKTVKKMEVSTAGTPLRALPKNIMREYKALCSTPSREQLMKTVDVTRGSEASGCIDLGVAFLGIEDEQPAYFPVPSKHDSIRLEDKENTLPEISDKFTASVENTTSLMEKRFNSVSTTGSLTGDESESAISVIERRFPNSVSTAESLKSEESLLEINDAFPEINLETTPRASTPMDNKSDEEVMKTVEFKNTGKNGTIVDDGENATELTSKIAILTHKKVIRSNANKSEKTEIRVPPLRGARRSVCEPNLETNRPSRILNLGAKRQSLLPTTKKKIEHADAESEIPLLMNKMLKITSSESDSTKKTNETKNIKIQKNETTDAIKKPLHFTEKRRSIMLPSKGRSSILPSVVGDKRTYSFTHRMSVVVKTTLNSPARKIARKSLLGTTNTQQQRRSLLATKSTQTMRMNKVDSGVRRSMLPNTSNARLTQNPLACVKESETAQQIGSALRLVKQTEDLKVQTAIPFNGKSRQNTEQLFFTCNVCKEKFRIKSLLDAHKRSHEGDIAAPNVKKQVVPPAPKTSNAPLLHNNSNICKYCDKKFALVRALHIHLLQNCSKIPPSEKRKLEYTEMNHVEKARLPSVFHHSNGANVIGNVPLATTRNVKTNGTKIAVEHVKENDSKKYSAEVLSRNVEGSLTNVNTLGSSQKPKKASAHSGVYRTPSKTVPCHICKLTFKSILDYTNHSLSTHGSKSQQYGDNSSGH